MHRDPGGKGCTATVPSQLWVPWFCFCASWMLPVVQVFLQARDPAQGWARKKVNLGLCRSNVTSRQHFPAPRVHTPGNDTCTLHSHSPLGQVQVQYCACFTVQTWSQLQWYMPVIPVLERLRQEDHEFQACLDGIVRL